MDSISKTNELLLVLSFYYSIDVNLVLLYSNIYKHSYFYVNASSISIQCNNTSINNNSTYYVLKYTSYIHHL